MLDKQSLGAATDGAAGTTHVFRETEPLSTYLIAFAAGPWATFTSTGSSRPLTLYMRRSRASEVEADSIILADDRAATQGETVAWLCSRLGVPPPPTVPLASLHETLRGDRAVKNSRLRALGWVPRYPDFETGFAAVLKAEGIPLSAL